MVLTHWRLARLPQPQPAAPGIPGISVQRHFNKPFYFCINFFLDQNKGFSIKLETISPRRHMYKEKFLDHTNSEEAGIRVFAQTGLSGERIVKAVLQGGGEGVFLPPANQKA